ncbi:MAG: hypothetical protein WBW53_16700 [Terriglobales bacterium]
MIPKPKKATRIGGNSSKMYLFGLDRLNLGLDMSGKVPVKRNTPICNIFVVQRISDPADRAARDIGGRSIQMYWRIGATKPIIVDY